MTTNGNPTATRTIPDIHVGNQQAAAADRRRAFPYRFPRDSRPLGGRFTVAENARRLLRFVKTLELRTRELFTECLVNLGAVTKDMDLFTVSREDIEYLVGE